MGTPETSPQLGRRRFLQLGGAGAAAAGLSMFPPAIAKAMALPAISRTKSIKDVQHVVILMQENRSFDHYFGTLRGVRGFADPRPALLPNGKPVFHQPTSTIKTARYQGRNLPASESEVLPWYIDPRSTTEHTAGTDHGWPSGHQAWNGGRWDSWVTQKQDVLTMGHLKRQDLLYHYALAEAFTIGDAYHCSVHADTAPNRIYLWTGTMDPRNVYGKTKLNGPATGERDDTNGYTWTTYPELLEQAGVSWKLYQGGSGIPGQPTDNFTDNSLMFFHNFQPADGADPNSPLVKKGACDHTLVEFAQDVKNGTLPQVTWIVPPAQYSEHPSSSPTDGAYYINLVMEALTANPEVWGSTVLLLDYDENDGLFDHVLPPVPPLHSAPGGEGMVSDSLAAGLQDEFLDMTNLPWTSPAGTVGPTGLQPIGLGPRVPMIAISPWSRGGYVCSETFDHTSVLRFLEQRFGIASPYISDWRRSVCGDLTSMFDFKGKADPTPVHFQVPAPIAGQGKPYSVAVPQTMPVQESGTRPARPLGYRALVNEGPRQSGRVQLELRNHGKIGAAFQIHDRQQPQAAPRRYTVAAHDTLQDFWTVAAGEHYQLAAYGPNGSLFEFQGQGGEDLSVAFSQTGQDEVRVRIRNHGKDRRTVRLANSYQHDGKAQVTRVLKAHDSLEYSWHTAGQGNWYDVRVSAVDGTAFERRYAGHLENGEHSTSDPGPAAG
ncbi:phosphocholine-specific phospholipase C [Kitasatospora sp. NPDC008050]|uniref:phosphocholine-specific phospholipase C n=1 Tax=Kitasatospora sp. NPDC008050 TaxID=3364021 RepID=UPI0036EB62C6